MSGGSSTTQSQTTSSAPWKPAQGALKGAINQAQNLLDNKKGFKAYPGQGWVDFSPETNQALGSMASMAQGPNPFYGGASNFTQGLLGGNYNLDQSGYQALQGQGPNTEGDYRAMLDGENTAYAQMRQNTANTLGDQIQRQFGGASYGAPENADYLTRGVGDVLTRMDSDNYFQRQAMKQGLLNNITGVQQQAFDNQRGLLGDMSNLSQQDINNRMGGLSMMDSVYNSQFLPAQMLAGVGAAKEAKAGEELQSKMDKFNINQQSKWNQLAQAMGVFTGTGAQGNQTQTSVSQPTDWWSKLLGGGLLASQVF
jgi:hypothetical protein